MVSAREYYRRSEILEYIYDYCKDREVAVFNKNGKIISKRPESFENDGDIIVYIDDGGYSIHSTIEKWYDPLGLSSTNTKDYVKLVKSYDFVIDIDTKLFDNHKKNLTLSQFIALHIIEELKSFGVTPNIKFSGNRGFHIILPLNGIKTLAGLDVLQFKEEIYRAFLSLIYLFTKEAISKLSTVTSLRYLSSKLMPQDLIDPQLASWRHMIRVPYSLHEKTGLASIVLDEDNLESFDITKAKPENIYDTIPIEPSKNLKDLLLIALGYYYLHDISKQAGKKSIKYLKKVPKHPLPPCVRTLLNGVPPGIRNNTMFFLITFFKKLGYSKDEVERIIKEWNEKNPEPLKDREVEYAVEYHFTRADYMPYSCEKLREYIGRQYCQPDEICQYISHPLQYVRFVNRLKRASKQQSTNVSKKA